MEKKEGTRRKDGFVQKLRSDQKKITNLLQQCDDVLTGQKIHQGERIYTNRQLIQIIINYVTVVHRAGGSITVYTSP